MSSFPFLLWCSTEYTLQHRFPQRGQKQGIMPYTALQLLGRLAYYNRWERMFSVRYTHSTKRSRCRLRAINGKYTKSGRRVIIFKRTGPGKTMNWWAENPPCGLPNCKACGVFIRGSVEELEIACLGLVGRS